MLSELDFNELDKRYRGTVAIITNLVTKEKKVVTISGFEQKTKRQYLVCSDGFGQTQYVLSEYKIEGIHKSSAFIHNGLPYFYSRLPLRQFRKGFCIENSGFHGLDFYLNTNGLNLKYLRHSNTRENSIVTFVESLIKTNYSHSLSVSISKLQNSTAILADCVTEKYTVVYVSDSGKVNFILYLNETPIAFISTTSLTITVSNPVFAQEVHDFCKAYGNQHYTVRGF